MYQKWTADPSERAYTLLKHPSFIYYNSPGKWEKREHKKEKKKGKRKNGEKMEI